MNIIIKIILFVVGIVLILLSIGGFLSKDYLIAGKVLLIGLFLAYLGLKEVIKKYYKRKNLQMGQKSWYKRWWAITIYIVLAFLIIGSILEEESQTSSTSIEKQIKQTGSVPTKLLFEMLPSRQDIPTEFKMESPYNMTLRQIPKGFDSAVRIEATKIVGSAGLIKLNFNIIKFDSDETARRYHIEDTNRIKNEGGYTEIDIEVPSKAECFSFTEDYGYDGRFATSDCLKGNLAYQVVVTAAYTFENPKKYIKDMAILLDNRINR